MLSLYFSSLFKLSIFERLAFTRNAAIILQLIECSELFILVKREVVMALYQTTSLPKHLKPLRNKGS
jgi:hypothetical protein